MNVIIVVPSKHGSTRAIATTIGEELRSRGIEVTIADPDEASLALDGYDAAVIGSAIYLGNWMKQARTFLTQHHEQLRTMPVWLFSSGPLDAPSGSRDPLAKVDAITDRLVGRDHAVFAGNLEMANLNLAERATIRLVPAPFGDARDWDQIRAWARSIALELTESAMSAPGSSDRRH